MTDDIIEEPARPTDIGKAVTAGNRLGIELVKTFGKHADLLKGLNAEETVAAIAMAFSTAGLAAFKWMPFWDVERIPRNVKQIVASKCIQSYLHYISVMTPKYKLGEPCLDVNNELENPLYFVNDKGDVKPVATVKGSADLPN